MKKKQAVKTEDFPIEKLKTHPRNYNDHPEDQLEHIIQSIADNGIYRNIIIAKDNTILAGHGVVLAAKKMGYKKLPIIKLPIKSDSPKALKILVGDNEISHLGMKDDRQLSEILKEIHDYNIDELLGTGYDEAMLANLIFVTRPESEIQDIDAAAEWVGMPDYEPGEIPFKLIVLCHTEEDRINLMKKIKAKVINRKLQNSWSIWYPEREKKDPSSIRFEG